MPLGPYKTFGECVGAQKRKGKSDSSAQAICGQIEKKTQEGLKKQASSNVKYEDANNRLYIKAFLLDASVNINQWGISPNSLDKQINTFIGKPLVLTESFNHPMPPDVDRVGSDDDDEYYDDDENPSNTVKVDEIVDHWLQYQESYRVGSIVDITYKNGTYYAIIEVTDAAAKEAFRNNDLPLFVSPAIAQLNPYENPSNITDWTGIHLAIVSNPAYTIKKAIISGQCHENGSERNDNGKCLLQLRQAAIQDKKIPRIGCGFCRTGALQRYAEIVRDYNISTHLVKDLDTFVNSSFRLSDTQNKTELTDQNTNNNNQTTDTNKPQEFEQKQQEQGGDLGEQNQKGKETVKTEKETEETTTVTKEAAEVGLKVAGMQECIQIFQQNGVDPNQAGQICKLAAQALMDNQNGQPGGAQGGQGAPKSPGQFGSVNEFDKLLAKKDLQIEKLSEELKHFKKNDKSDAQRIAELEEQLSNLNLQLKEKELDSYLATKISDAEARTAKVKKFAGLNLSLDDVKEIFEDYVAAAPPGNTGQKVAVKKTAEVDAQSILSKPVGKVKLQTASTNESEQQTQTNSGNEIRERNNRILSSLLNKGGIN